MKKGEILKKQKTSPIIACSGKVFISGKIQDILSCLEGTIQDEYSSEALAEMVLPILPPPPFDSAREAGLLQCVAMLGDLLVKTFEQLDECDVILDDLMYLAPDEVTKKASYQNYLKRRVFGSTSEKTCYLVHPQENAPDDSGNEKRTPGKQKKSHASKNSPEGKPDSKKSRKSKGMPDTDQNATNQSAESQSESMPGAEGSQKDVPSEDDVQTTTIGEPVQGQSPEDGSSSECDDIKHDTPPGNTRLQSVENNACTDVMEEGQLPGTAKEETSGKGLFRNNEAGYEGESIGVPSPQQDFVELPPSHEHYYERIHEGCAPGKLLGRKKTYAPRQKNLASHRFSEDVIHVERYTTLDDPVGWREAPPLDSAGFQMRYHGRKYVHTIARMVCYIEAVDVYKQVYVSNHVTDEEGHLERRYSPFQPAVEKGMYIDEGIIARMITDKLLYGIPTHRQLKMLSAKGLFLPDSTFSKWCVSLYEKRVIPIIKTMWDHFYQCGVGHADATWIRVMLEDGKANRTKSYINCYATGMNEKYQMVLLQYAPTKEADHFRECIEGFPGVMVTDAASELSWIEVGRHACCMAHARQEMFEALPTDPKVREKSRAMEGVKLWDKIFEAERGIESENPVEHLAKHLEVLDPEIKKLEKWMTETRKTASPKCKLVGAINYYYNHRDELRMCLKDGNIPLTNMLIENLIRFMAVLRKNCMLFGSPAGAIANLGWASLVLSAYLNGLDCEKYIAYILRKTKEEGWDEPAIIIKLMPWSPECSSASPPLIPRDKNSPCGAKKRPLAKDSLVRNRFLAPRGLFVR